MKDVCVGHKNRENQSFFSSDLFVAHTCNNVFFIFFKVCIGEILSQFQVMECKDCLSERRRIFPVMIYCYFYTLANLSVTELTNNTINTSIFSLKVKKKRK